MADKCFCHFNGYEVKDAAARKAAAAAQDDATAARRAAETNASNIQAAIDSAAAAVDTANMAAAGFSSTQKAVETLEERVDNFTTLPEGSTTGDAELADARVSFGGRTHTNAGGAIRAQAAENFRMISESNDYSNNLGQHTDGHFYKIIPDKHHNVARLRNVSGSVTESGTYPGSDYIKCPKYLSVTFSTEDDRAYLYFYTLTDNGAYAITWDVFKDENNAGYLNFINFSMGKLACLEIPEGTYMRIIPMVGDIKYYGWDGEMFGIKLCADASFTATDGTTGALNKAGTGNITIPGAARLLVMTGGNKMTPVHGWKNGKATLVQSTKESVVVLPEGYDFFTARFWPTETETVTGDISAFTCAVVPELESEKASGRAVNVLAAAEKINSLRWTPAENFVVNSDTSRTFKKGVTYNGLPYSSKWNSPHFIGWHVSPHTFINAVNDPNSIFYKEKSTSGGTSYPFYGVVCSSYATMADGWPYPQTNAGFIYDPNIIRAFAAVPPIGTVWSDITTHCVIPARVDHMEENWAISAYESIKPVSAKTIRYSNVKKSNVDDYNTGYGADYYDAYGLAVRHMAAGGLNNVPYADFTGAKITGGSARPYKGDKSVYTSAEDSVKINISNSAASYLFLAKDNGDAKKIETGGETVIDVKAALTGPGIYTVWTDADTTVKESFEYVEVTPITWKLVDGCVQFSSNDFWYASIYMKGDPLLNQWNKACMVPANASGDYSDWCRNGHYMEGVGGILKKGRYGAYSVPCTEEI